MRRIRTNWVLRNSLINQGLIRPAIPVTPRSLEAQGFFFAAAALRERLSRVAHRRKWNHASVEVEAVSI